MSRQTEIRPAEGIWVVRAGGAVIGESSTAQEVLEPGREPVIYFPRADIAMALLERSDKSYTCSLKGQATYYTIVAKSGPITDAAWSYEAPPEAMAGIAGHLAFTHEKVAVEEV